MHPRFLAFSYLLFVFHCACLVSTHDLTMHLAEHHTTACPCPICTLMECCLSQFIVSLHAHRCVTSGILPSCLILLPIACLQGSLRVCLGSITPFSPSPVIELNAWTIRPCFKGNV